MTTEGSLTDRLRDLLASEATIREVQMFGGRSFMVNEKLAVSALKDGDLLARVSSERHHELIELPGAYQAEMGAGRSMGDGWIGIEADAIGDDAQLSFWVGAALDHNRAVTRDRP